MSERANTKRLKSERCEIDLSFHKRKLNRPREKLLTVSKQQSGASKDKITSQPCLVLVQPTVQLKSKLKNRGEKMKKEIKRRAMGGNSECLIYLNKNNQLRLLEAKIPSKIISCLLFSLSLSLFLLILEPTPCLALVPVPNRHTVASIPGDLVIGILVPVHERPSPKQAQTRTCGAVREQYGIQRVEAAFRTIDSINADPNILPNITLGIEIRDSCWHSPIALEQSIEFIRDAMAASEQTQAKPNLAQAGAQLATSGTSLSGLGSSLAASAAATSAASLNESSICAPLLLRQQQNMQLSKKVKNIVGVVGPASSTDTVQVQNLLQLFNMPQVGYSATSRDLSNKNFFKYFLRVVPSDKLQAQVMIDLMMAHNWTYITVAYTEGSYGSSLMNAFRERAQEVGICFATLESMPPNADDAKFDELIEAIQKHPNARVVICMCEGRTVGKLFAGFKRKNITNEYLVVGSDGWSDRFDVVEKQEEFALGGISIRIHSAYVNDFDDYYFALNPFTNHRNPWFAEFWETRFQCNLELGSKQQQQQQHQNTINNQHQAAIQQRPFVRPPGAKVYNRTCTGRESLRNNHKQDAKMAFVQKSIITMALGLDSMQRANCPPNKPGLCPEMLPVNGSTLLQHLMNVSFSFLNEQVYFDEQGDPPGKYEILNFQRRRPVHTENQFASSYPDPSSSDPPPAAAAGEQLTTDSIELQATRLSPLDDSSQAPTGTTIKNNLDSNSFNESSKFSIEEQRKRIANPLYNSYSTLKVFRKTPPAEAGTRGEQQQTATGASNSPTGAAQQRRRRQRRRTQLTTGRAWHPPASGYSSTSGYEYVLVGSWKSSDGLSLFGDIRWPTAESEAENSESNQRQQQLIPSVDSVGPQDIGSPTNLKPHHVNVLPKSVCSLPCARGQAKKIQSDSVKCCWVCVPCRPNEYLYNEFKCKACEKGWWPNSIRTGCDQIPIHYLDWRSMEALIAIFIAIFGLILTLATGIVFIRHNNTPVVKSSTRELSYMILFAMLLCHVNTFFLVAKPSKYTCFVTRVLPGFSFAMMYGALVTKTNRIARILAGSKKKIITRRPRFMSATSQVAISWLIIFAECLIIVFMLIREPADKMHDFPSDERVVLVCNTTTMGIIAPLGYDFFLIAMCTLYAFKTRNVPENFNEAKFIGFTMYTTLVIWIAFVAIYVSSDHKVTTLCLCISFSALFALFLLFFPRCYIIIFKPEKNNRSYFTTTKNVRCHIGYKIGSAGAAAAAAAATASAAQQLQHSSTGASLVTTATTTQALSTVNSAGHLSGFGGVSASNHISHGPCCFSASNSLDLANEQSELGQQRVANSSGHCQWSAPAETNRSRVGQANFAARHWRSDISDSAVCWPRESSVISPNSVAMAEAATVSPSGKIQPAEQLNGGALLRSLIDTLVAACSRRSRRKESDKVSSIQQHLRAIRHAEDLDRQTHFRRSQVQRLAQRFDSGSISVSGIINNSNSFCTQNEALVARGANCSELDSNNWPLRNSAMTGSQTGGVGHASALMNLRSSIKLLANSLRALPSSMDEMHRSGEPPIEWQLLILLSQLIGPQKIWQLAEMLKRHYQASEGHQSAAERGEHLVSASECNANKLANCVYLLDLSKFSDQKLALALLDSLAEQARKSMEEIRGRQLLLMPMKSNLGSNLTGASARLGHRRRQEKLTKSLENSTAACDGRGQNKDDECGDSERDELKLSESGQQQQDIVSRRCYLDQQDTTVVCKWGAADHWTWTSEANKDDKEKANANAKEEEEKDDDDEEQDVPSNRQRRGQNETQLKRSSGAKGIEKEQRAICELNPLSLTKGCQLQLQSEQQEQQKRPSERQQAQAGLGLQQQQQQQQQQPLTRSALHHEPASDGQAEEEKEKEKEEEEQTESGDDTKQATVAASDNNLSYRNQLGDKRETATATAPKVSLSSNRKDSGHKLNSNSTQISERLSLKGNQLKWRANDSDSPSGVSNGRQQINVEQQQRRLQARNAQDNNNNKDKLAVDEDPIKRALECIMGPPRVSQPDVGAIACCPLKLRDLHEPKVVRGLHVDVQWQGSISDTNAQSTVSSALRPTRVEQKQQRQTRSVGISRDSEAEANTNRGESQQQHCRQHVSSFDWAPMTLRETQRPRRQQTTPSMSSNYCPSPDLDHQIGGKDSEAEAAAEPQSGHKLILNKSQMGGKVSADYAAEFELEFGEHQMAAGEPRARELVGGGARGVLTNSPNPAGGLKGATGGAANIFGRTGQSSGQTEKVATNMDNSEGHNASRQANSSAPTNCGRLKHELARNGACQSISSTTTSIGATTKSNERTAKVKNSANSSSSNNNNKETSAKSCQRPRNEQCDKTLPPAKAGAGTTFRHEEYGERHASNETSAIDSRAVDIMSASAYANRLVEQANESSPRNVRLANQASDAQRWARPALVGGAQGTSASAIIADSGTGERLIETTGGVHQNEGHNFYHPGERTRRSSSSRSPAARGRQVTAAHRCHCHCSCSGSGSTSTSTQSARRIISPAPANETLTCLKPNDSVKADCRLGDLCDTFQCCDLQQSASSRSSSSHRRHKSNSGHHNQYGRHHHHRHHHNHRHRHNQRRNGSSLQNSRDDLVLASVSTDGAGTDDKQHTKGPFLSRSCGDCRAGKSFQPQGASANIGLGPQ